MRRASFLNRPMSNVLQWKEHELQPDSSQLRWLFLQALARTSIIDSKWVVNADGEEFELPPSCVWMSRTLARLTYPLMAKPSITS
ncbi:MAG: hypothetical protein IKP00_09775 [Victivallales bacterium]|nr:hypothetical protein [Victivallales bacterium]